MHQRRDIWTIVAADDVTALRVGRRRRPARRVMEKSGLEVAELLTIPSARRPLVVSGRTAEPITYLTNMVLAVPPGRGRPEWLWTAALWVVRTRVGSRLLGAFAPRVLIGRRP